MTSFSPAALKYRENVSISRAEGNASRKSLCFSNSVDFPGVS